jgi:hypothetical protein
MWHTGVPVAAGGAPNGRARCAIKYSNRYTSKASQPTKRPSGNGCSKSVCWPWCPTSKTYAQRFIQFNQIRLDTQTWLIDNPEL